MRIKTRGFLGVLLALYSAISFAVPTIQHWQTANGVKVYFVPTDGLPIIDAQLVFKAGSAYDKKQLGVAALTSALLDQGANGLTAQQIAEQLENVGAHLSTSTSRDFSAISFRSLTDKKVLKKSWETLTQVLNKPDFNLADVQREKKQTLLAIKGREESPGIIAQLALYQQMYKKHPYANPIQGLNKTVEAIKVSDVKAFYQTNYVAKKLVVVMVGGISRQKAEKLVDTLVSHLKPGVAAMPLPAVSKLGKAVFVHKDYPSQQTHLMYALPVMANNDPDYFALTVGNHILGGSGFSSRIVKEIREKRGLAYSAYSYFHPMVQQGPFIMGLQTRNEKVAEAIKATKKTLHSFIEEGPTEEELKAAKNNITGGFALRLDSNKKLLANVAGLVNSGLPLDYLNTYIENIKTVSIKQIIDAFQRRVVQDNMVMVTVGQPLSVSGQ